MPAAWRRYQADALCLVSLLLLAGVFFWPVTTGLGYIPRGGGDLASFLWPTYSYAAAAYTSGRVPLWNPTLYAGAPFAADPQTTTFYPPNLITYLLVPGFPYRALELLVVGHVWLAGAGLYALVRLWLGPGSERWPALAGAVALMFCDVFVIHVGNYNIIAAAAWLPWAQVGLHQAGVHARARDRALAALALALSALAGHAQLTVMVWAAAGLYAVCGLVEAWGRNPRAGMAYALSTLASFVGAALLAAVALLPAVELQTYTARAALRYDQASEFSLPWAGLAGLFSPLLLGRGSGDFWAPWPRVEAGYVGVPTLLLAGLAVSMALASLGRGRTRSPVADPSPAGGRDLRAVIGYLAVLAVFGLLLALGPNTPFHGWVYDTVSVFRGLRVPARFIFLTDFALAGLAAIGLHLLVGASRRHWWGSVAVVGLVGGAAMAYGFAAANAAAGGARTPWLGLAVAGGLGAVTAVLGDAARHHLRGRWRGAIWLVLVADLVAQGAWVEVDVVDPTAGYQHPSALGFLTSRDPPTRVDVVAMAMAPDAGARFGFDDMEGIYNPLGLAAMQTYRDTLGPRGSARYDFLAVQWVVADKDQPPAADPDIVPVFNDDPKLDVYLNTAAQPRVTVRGTVVPAGAGQALERLLDPAFDITTAAVIEPLAALPNGEAGALPLPAMGSSAGDGHVLALERYDPEAIRVRVATPGPAWLLVADGWYPGWRATVNGAPTPIYRANLAFRAVPLTAAGEHVVEMAFLPASQVWGALLSLLGLVVLAADGLLARERGGLQFLPCQGEQC